jgi:hypothetical protein
MTEKLEEIVASAARNPASYPDLTLLYQRGHDLSGVTRFELRADGAFTLNSNNPRRHSQVSFAGDLEANQREAILAGIEETRLFGVPSSTRAIGDDEIPIVVELSNGDLRHRWLIWAGDALKNADFQRFEKLVWNTLRQISHGEIGPGPSGSAS